MAMDQEQRTRARWVWDNGDYPALAAHIEPGAWAVAAAAGPGDGCSALEVAAGTGSLALDLTARGWQVTAVDIAPRLIEAGRTPARIADQDIRWREASMYALPAPDGSVDLVASSFGLVFAADPQEMLAEARRVLRPGGLLAFSAWTPAGFMGRMTSRMGDVLSAREQLMGPFRWGDPGVTSAWLAEDFTRLGTQVHTLPWVFGSAREATTFLFEPSPGHLASLETAGPLGSELIGAVADLFAAHPGPDGSVDLPVEYVVTTARRPQTATRGS